jgi:hypothetical protein
MKIHSLSFLSLCISSAVALRDNASTGLLSTGDGVFLQSFIGDTPY